MLIQSFGLGAFQRGNQALTVELGDPRSNTGRDWLDLVKQHPGFFGVTGQSEMMSLSLRYIDSSDHPRISLPMIELLMKEAVDLQEAEVSRIERANEREARRVERRNVLIAALIAGFSAIIASFIAVVIKPK